MKRFFYDLEFLEDGNDIDTISIGIVCEDGREYYAINRDARWNKIRLHDWLYDNVLPSLPSIDIKHNITLHGEQKPMWVLDNDHPDVKFRCRIANEVRDFLLQDDDKPQLWAWYAAYDHVALCQLWGPMTALHSEPLKGIPKLTYDLKQECDSLGNPRLPEQAEGEHNALEDARHNLVRARFLAEQASRSGHRTMLSGL